MGAHESLLGGAANVLDGGRRVSTMLMSVLMTRVSGSCGAEGSSSLARETYQVTDPNGKGSAVFLVLKVRLLGLFNAKAQRTKENCQVRQF